jgi:3-keto-5-aminohexanoate cleavage enzyme
MSTLSDVGQGFKERKGKLMPAADKLIITVALNGSVPTKAMNPNVPITAEELGIAAAACQEAGASIVHVHARDAAGKPTLDPEIFARIHAEISARTDLIVQISTGARAGADTEARAESVRRIRPEMASLTTGSMNFPDQVYENGFPVIERLAEVMQEAGTKPEMEIFEAGMIENALGLIAKGLVTPPLHFDFVLGSRGSQSATARQLVYLAESIPPESTWCVAALGRWQLPMGILAIAMGGHVRVGLEDNIYYRRGELASNPQLVARMARIAAEAEREVATPDEARALLSMPPRPPSENPR